MFVHVTVVFVNRVRALSPAKLYKQQKMPNATCAVLPQLGFYTRSGFFPCRLGFWVFLSVTWVFFIYYLPEFFPCRKLNKKLSYCRENCSCCRFCLRSSKVIDFDPNRKRVYDFLIVRTTYWPKIAIFATPLSLNIFAKGDPFRIYG